MGQGNMNLGIFTNNIDNRLFGHTVEWKVKKKKSDRTVEKHKKKQEYRNYTVQQYLWGHIHVDTQTWTTF